MNMNKRQSELARQQLDRKLRVFRNATESALDGGNASAMPRTGWIKAIRNALGMSVRQLAGRIGAVPSRISAIESAELTGGITLKTLRQVAEGLDCTLVYAFVPKAPLDEVVRRRAVEKANSVIARLDHTMRLENQAIDGANLRSERDRLADEFMSGSMRKLWTDD